MISAHKKRQMDRKAYFSSKENLLRLLQPLKGSKMRGCPHCKSDHIVKYGIYKDRQRYKCKECKKTFNDHTNTPLHRTKHLQKWLKFLECMVYGYSLRMTAIKVGVTYVTIFYWRHKMIKAFQIVENDNHLDRFFPKYSYPYICVKQNPPAYAVYPEERQSFKAWIQSFAWISRKYLKRYISWFRLITKTESLPFFEKRMSELLVSASSIPLEQTYQNVRHAS